MYPKKINFLSTFLTNVALLISIGLVFVYSASAVYALEHIGSGNFYVKKQLFGLVLGIIGMLVAACIPLAWINRLSFLVFLTALSVTMLTLVPSWRHTVHGSGRWIFLGPLSLQPSEFLKYALLVYIASFIAKKEHRIDSFFKCYFPCLLMVGITSLMLLKQPDFGLTMTICATVGILFFITKMPLRFLLSTLAAGLPMILYLVIKTPYRFHRIMSFLHPWNDPQGSGFQIIQSLIAIGSGGLLGRGIGSSKQKFFYLPMQHTDFIFSIIAEETGFIGASLLIIIYSALLYSGFKIAWSLHDPFAIYTTLGFVILITMQALTNLLVTTGLVPTKGVGLPFVSYGNSALIANLLMVGLIINFVRNNDKTL